MAEHRVAVPAGGGGPEAELSVRWQHPDAARLAFFYLHGFGSSQGGEKATYFRRRAAEANHAFCSFDFRGHGDSGGTLPGLTLSRNLEDAETVLAWLRRRWDGPLVFFGSSVGGATAMWLAERHPESFAAGLAIAPALGMEAELQRRVGEAGLEEWRRSGRLPMRNELVETELSWSLMEDLAHYPPDVLPATYRTPTLIFQGAGDESVDWRAVATFAAACDAPVELHLFADGDHRLLAQRPRLWELAAGFLATRI